MSTRHLPVRPDLTQLKHQAKDLLRAIKKNDADAVADLRAHVPGNSDPSTTTLADAQLALARSYGVGSWPRLVAACDVIDAIWSDDLKRLRALVVKRPALIREMARGTERCNWGPPMSYNQTLFTLLGSRFSVRVQVRGGNSRRCSPSAPIEHRTPYQEVRSVNRT